jgi:CspA family cold shock protein
MYSGALLPPGRHDDRSGWSGPFKSQVSPCLAARSPERVLGHAKLGPEASHPREAVHQEADMPTGVVKFYNSSKGFGFVQPDEGGADVFVHVSALEAAGIDSLNEGQKLSFEVVADRGKTKAANLQVL